MKSFNLTILISIGLFLLSACGKKMDEIKPIRKDITETVFASGVLIPENQYNLTAQTEGYLISLNFQEGDIVKPGDILAVIDNQTSDINSQGAALLLEIARTNASPNSPVLQQINANLKVAEKKLKQDKEQVDRYEKLYETKSVSKLEYENIQLAYETSKANYNALMESYKLQKQQADQQLISQKMQSDVTKVVRSNNVITAVIGGKVYNKFKELGDYVRRGEVIAVIGDPKNLYTKLSIDESSISKVKLNQEVVIQLNIDKNKNYSGIITEIYPSFDSKTQSFNCKVKFTEPPSFGIAGTQVQANIITSKKEDILVIPRNYLDYGSQVLIEGKGKVNVKTGFVSNEWVEIISGIDETITIQAEKK